VDMWCEDTRERCPRTRFQREGGKRSKTSAMGRWRSREWTARPSPLTRPWLALRCRQAVCVRAPSLVDCVYWVHAAPASRISRHEWLHGPGMTATV
jgi:hypothetical protein